MKQNALFISLKKLTFLFLLFSFTHNSFSNDDKYTINLMWINRARNEQQKYIYPAENKEELSKKFLTHLFNWAQANPEGIVNLWFDSFLTPTNAVKETKKLISQYLQQHPELSPIILRDVRTLSYVTENPKIFSEKMPIFFRVDLLRVIAQVHDISSGITPYFVYSDLDMKPVSKEELFDTETMQKLRMFGIVMAHHPTLGFENGFSIVSNHNPHLLQAMQYTLIDLNIQRAYNALENKFYKSEHISDLNSLVESTLQQGNPSIPLTHPIPGNYSINIKLINNTPQKNQKYIFPGLNDKESLKIFCKPILLWANTHPKAEINIWYDSKTTSVISIKNTTQCINNEYPAISNIIFRDIQDLPYVQAHPTIFTHKTPELRDKMLEIISAMHDISTGRTSYCIFGTLYSLKAYKHLFDLNSIAPQELFNKSTMESLQKSGINISEKNHVRIGIMGGNIDHLFKFLKHDWIEPNKKKASQRLHGIACYDSCCQMPLVGLQQFVWSSYPAMFSYLFHLMGFNKLPVKQFDFKSEQFVTHPYNKDKDGLHPFGLDRFTSKIMINGYIPTKKFNYPNTALIYDDNSLIQDHLNEK